MPGSRRPRLPRDPQVTYRLLLTGPLLPERVAEVLAEQFRCPVGAVGIGGVDDDHDRDWDAPVGCRYEALHGDASWALDVHPADPGLPRPTAPDLAGALAEALGGPVLFGAAGLRPSAYWLAAPGGLLTRARLYELDRDEPGVTIDAVQQPVPQLPDVPVDPLAETVGEPAETWQTRAPDGRPWP